MSDLAQKIAVGVGKYIFTPGHGYEPLEVREIIARHVGPLEHERDSWRINCRKIELEHTIAASEVLRLQARLAKLEAAARKLTPHLDFGVGTVRVCVVCRKVIEDTREDVTAEGHLGTCTVPGFRAALEESDEATQ